MNSFDACRMFLALNNHFFQNSYDYFKYKGNVPLKRNTYDDKRQDERHRYDRLAHKFQCKEELENFIVANLIELDKRAWIGLLFGGEADNIYLKWCGRVQALQYNLVNEVKLLLENCSFNNLFKCSEHEHPEILKAYMRRDLSLESFVVLDVCLDFIPKLDKKLGDDRNWMIAKHKAMKYRPFIERLNIDVGDLSKAIQVAVKEMEVTDCHGDKK